MEDDTPEQAKAMTPVGNIWREISQHARQSSNPPRALDPRPRVGDAADLYNAAGEGVLASGNGTSLSPHETTRTPSLGIGGVFFFLRN
jgi:hypothetical protein